MLDRSGQVLTRIWCLYEIWQTVRRRGTRALRVLAAALDVGELRRVWGDLDVERAQVGARTHWQQQRVVQAHACADRLRRHG